MEETEKKKLSRRISERVEGALNSAVGKSKRISWSLVFFAVVAVYAIWQIIVVCNHFFGN